MDTSDSEEYNPRRKRPRRAAMKAMKKIKKELIKPEPEPEPETDEEYADEDNAIVIRVENGAPQEDKMKPRRYTIDEEPAEVQEFFKLISEPAKEATIDDQIDDFKSMDPNKKQELLQALKERPTTESSVQLMYKILTLDLKTDIKYMLLAKYNALCNLDPSTTEYYKHRNWLDKVCSIPFGKYKKMPVSLSDGSDACSKFMEQARNYLNQAAYGQDEAKLQILQFISSKIVNPTSSGMALLLVGPPGIGKTTLIKNGIARAIDWPFHFISLGGDSDGSAYMGHQLVYESSHCGKIVNSITASKSMSNVLMFDEIDKISKTPKGEEIQNMLVHLTDPVQNMEFEDKYVGAIPIDMSKTMFVFSANDITKIDRILLDRMTVIFLNGYTIDEKIVIADKYLLPSIVDSLDLSGNVSIDRENIKYIIDRYAKEEKGVRELRRCLESICQKINMLRLYNSHTLPFHINGFALPIVVTRQYIDMFLKKKEPEDDRDISLKMMYL
jgi:ATP-dependent Lon protease